MEPVFFVLAWLAYAVLVWAAVILLDLPQSGGHRRSQNAGGKFLRRLYARGSKFAAPQ
jgi:hypothetical protein